MVRPSLPVRGGGRGSFLFRERSCRNIAVTLIDADCWCYRLFSTVTESAHTPSMRYHMIATVALGAVFASWQAVAQEKLPRVSATDTSYLSCTIWTGKGWTPPTSRSARTQLFQSPKGYRAYGEVKVIVKDGSCENSSTLYVAQAAEQPFKIAYAEARSGSGDGNGIRLIGWSASGEKLLAEVNFWKYESDTGFWHAPLIYDASTGTALEIRGLDKALTRHFGSDCEFEPAVDGWNGNEKIVVRVSRPPEDESYDHRFCVTGPRLLVYDLQNETVTPEMGK